jgi:hypothetical protein
MRQKEAMMEDFLAGFELALKQELERRSELETEVVTALEKYSSLLVQTQNMPRYSNIFTHYQKIILC